MNGKQIKDGTISAAKSDGTLQTVANKTTDGTLATNSDTKYPSEKAVKTYAPSRGVAWVMANHQYMFY